ncbi:unnamed protein product [Pipistrellus nathusii]|uniref:Uncharacterized protein n=1 Tax=Pipistrellus nathusii TaxID=59473 RepID=A0ABP0AD79_PIPNA
MGGSEQKAGRQGDSTEGCGEGCVVRLLTACGTQASGAVAAFPRKDKAEVGRGGLAPPLPPRSLWAHHHFLFFGSGWRHLEYFMQKLTANEVSTARPGKKRGMKGRARLTDLWSIPRRSVFSSVFQLPGSTPSGKYLNL